MFERRKSNEEKSKLIAPNIGSMYYTIEPLTEGKVAILNGVGDHNIKLDEKHCHSLDPRPTGIDKTSIKRLLWATIISFVAMVLVYFGGIMANSLSVLSDGACLTADVVSFSVNILTVYLSTKPSTRTHNFGLHRGEVLGGLLSILLLWVVTVVLIVLAIFRLFDDDVKLDGPVALITSGGALLVDIITIVILAPDYFTRCCTSKKNKRRKPIDAVTARLNHAQNISVVSAFWHLVCDAIHSIGVIAAAIVIYFRPDWTLTDPISTFVVSVIVFATSGKFVWDAVYILLEGFPVEFNFDKIKDSLLLVPGVLTVHDLRIWSLTSGRHVLTAHLAVLDDTLERWRLVPEKARDMLRKDYGIVDVTIMPEKYSGVMELCSKCHEPKDD